jgi:histidinol phosphatase-like PHP family hydrolase
MNTTRRDFIKKSAIASSIVLSPNLLFGMSNKEDGVQLIDYHVHASKYLTIEDAVANFESKNMKFGIVEHPGRRANIVDDKTLLSYIQRIHSFNALAGLQPIDPMWHETFSSEAISKLDHVIIDALEIPDGKGNREKIWEQRFILYNKSTFMDRYMDFHINVLENGKSNILANPTFLPICIAPDYYKLWTEKRMDKIIKCAVKNNVAFEINSIYQYPKKPFIQMAKEAGAKFSFGSNGHQLREVKNYEYCLEMVKECGLTKGDFFNLK